MLIFLVMLLSLTAILAYVAGIFILGTKIQEWCWKKGIKYDVAIPSAFICFFLIVVPISLLLPFVV